MEDYDDPLSPDVAVVVFNSPTGRDEAEHLVYLFREHNITAEVGGVGGGGWPVPELVDQGLRLLPTIVHLGLGGAGAWKLWDLVLGQAYDAWLKEPLAALLFTRKRH